MDPQLLCTLGMHQIGLVVGSSAVVHCPKAVLGALSRVSPGPHQHLPGYESVFFGDASPASFEVWA